MLDGPERKSGRFTMIGLLDPSIGPNGHDFGFKTIRNQPEKDLNLTNRK